MFKSNDRLNTFVAFDEIHICPTERLQLRLLQYFEDMVINFEYLAETNDVFSIHVFVNLAKKI